MKLIILFVSFMTTCYVLSSRAANTDWNNDTAYMLATASECAYRVTSRDPKESKKEVIKCFTQAAEEAEAEKLIALKVFSELEDDAVETFSTGKTLTDENDEINAAILVKIPGGVIVAFRGTEASFWDWLNNFELANINNITKNELYRNGRHLGFDKSLESLRNEINKDKTIWQPFIGNPSNKILYITGHSKGGALAAGATVEFAEIFKGEIVTYTFEAPRFFTAEGKDMNQALLKNLWRFEYQYDLVPHVPLGKVTYDLLLKEENQKYVAVLAWLLNFPPDWKSKIEKNNINFVPVGKLMYAEDKKTLVKQPDEKNGSFYEERFIASLKEIGLHIFRLDVKEFVLDQHSTQYLSCLRTVATQQ